VRGIVTLAESLDLTVVAEGLEYPAQVEQIRGMRARHGQGYLFSRPVAPDRLWALLQDPAGLAAAA
jgi:EAL domain-containing protein (putative c-di-GMP-specific phosphodiesterase class I)